MLLLALWRARRLGPVVAEPLPVVVRAAETVEGRARLYRRGGARGQAARGAARRRPVAGSGRALGLPRRADPPAVVDGGRRPLRPRPAPRSARSCTVPHRPTTPRWCGSPTTSTPSRERYADRDRPARRPPARADRPTPPTPRARRCAPCGPRSARPSSGQDAAVTGLVIALLCRGHVLLEGVPGVAKTLLVRTLAAALSLDTKRVQFTPDLMPGDVTGSLVYDARSSEFSFRAGPVFTNLLLADEINRTPPKTQAALLEAMEERQVSVDGDPRPLPDPFVVVATQNPVEYEGTYPLPEAQLDRFLLKLTMPLPPREDEVAGAAPGTPRASTRATWPAAGRPAGRRRRRPRGRPRRRTHRARSRPRWSATSSTWPGRPATRRRCSSASRRAAPPR